MVSFRSYYKYCALFTFLILFSAASHASDIDLISRLQFKQITTYDGLPTNEVQKVYQDKEGFLWMATRYGFCKYDGYQTTVYKSNLYTPGLLTNNNVYSLADDADGCLWIGTQEGLNALNKETGEIRHYVVPEIPNNVVSCLLVTRDNKVWVGTDYGLCQYVAEKDTFIVYDSQMTDGVLNRTTIKSLYEDIDGDVWIGTWNSGLFRYSPAMHKFFAYPQVNKQNSAHVIYQDSEKNIWVGGWTVSYTHLTLPTKRIV